MKSEAHDIVGGWVYIWKSFGFCCILRGRGSLATVLLRIRCNIHAFASEALLHRYWGPDISIDSHLDFAQYGHFSIHPQSGNFAKIYQRQH